MFQTKAFRKLAFEGQECAMAPVVTNGSAVLPTLLPELRANSRYRTPCLERLNRQRWVTGLCFRSYGIRVGVRVNTPEALEILLPTFPPGWVATADPSVDLLFSFILGGTTPGSKVRRYHLPYLFHMRLQRTLELAEALAAWEMYLDLAIAEHARARVFVHAGAVGWRGSALLVAGRTHTGKSTLVAALVRAGAAYYSDEYAVLDARGRVHPYLRPLALRGTNGEMPCRLMADELSGPVATRPLPVGLVLDTTYRKGAGWRPRRLSPGQGLLSLLNNTVPAQRRPKAVLRTLRTVVEHAPVLKGPRGEADEVARRILKCMEAIEPLAVDVAQSSTR
jgi:hypothetical protein